MAGIPPAGVLERTGLPRIPQAIIKYLFCCPEFDFKFRCLPSSGGFYDQRYRDFIEFNIIEQKLREIQARRGGGVRNN